MGRLRRVTGSSSGVPKRLLNNISTNHLMNRRNALGVSGLFLLGLNHLGAAESQAKDKNEDESNSKRFYHLHYFKFKEEVSEEEITQLMKELAGLKDKIPVLKEFWVGKNVSPHGRGFQWGEVALFEKPEDLEAYHIHPEHRKLVRKIGPKLAGGASMDFVPVEPI